MAAFDDDGGLEVRSLGGALTIFGLVFGGLSVVAQLSAMSLVDTSSVLEEAVRVWDKILHFVLGPLSSLLQRVVTYESAVGIGGAGLQSWWPHSVLVGLFVGFASLHFAARRHVWIYGVAWFFVVCCLTLAVLSNVNPLELAAVIGNVVGGAFGATMFAGMVLLGGIFFIVAAVILGVRLYLDLDLALGIRVSLRLLEVFSPFVGAAIFLFADNTVRGLI